MADTITINGTTYHKLVTFKDCASTENGGQGLFPWAFMRKKDNFSDIQSYPYINGVEEISDNRCIDTKDISLSPLRSKTSYPDESLGTLYKKCVNKDDLIFIGNTDTSHQIPIKLTGKETGVTNDVYGRLYRDDTNIAEIMYSRDGNNNWVEKDEYLDLPTANGQVIKVQNIKNSNEAGYHFTFYIKGYLEGSIDYGYYHSKNTSAGFKLDYMPLYAGNISNYTKFWNICRIAKNDGKFIEFEFKCNS